MSDLTQQEIDESYETTDGIEFDGKTSGAFFGYDSKYKDQEGNEILCLVVDVDPLPGDTDDTKTQLFAVGKGGWEAIDNGAGLSAAAGRKPKKLQNQAAYGELLTSALAIPELAKVLKSRGTALQASIWDGLALSFGSVTRSAKMGKDKEERTWTRTIVTDFYPELSDLSGLTATTATAASSAPAEPELTGNGIPTAMEDSLRALAAETPSHPDFMERAIVEVPGVEGNDMAEALIADPAVYTQFKGA